MNQSKIETQKLEQQPNGAVKADGLSSAQVEQNPLLSAVFVVPADYDEGPECEDEGCIFCNDIHCDGESCQDEDW